jgi:hypothetical protein
MKQFNVLFSTIAGAAFALACVHANAGTNDTGYNRMDSNSAATIMLADNSSNKPAVGGEDDAAMGGNAPNPEPDRAVGTVVDDASITAKVKSKLLADTTVGGLKIDVDTRSGVVYLTGDHMKNQAEIDHAIKLAEETSGVKKVESKLAVGDVKS